MHEPANLYAWDAVVAAFLNSRHAIGRAYVGEEQVLRHLRSFLVRSGAVDLDTATFDRWRRQFQHLRETLIYQGSPQWSTGLRPATILA
ncbi:MAG: hypothetical protein Q8R98_14820 [Rubrivivax sp.]|jgi:hypothetical protein|nr:hypothetical protein [Rubrivivax sp.]MDP3223793.1 hypothetical protein [Rubrivivax sp.]MDP3613127.1 hypothetical protein [Rubrivivax sp.]